MSHTLLTLPAVPNVHGKLCFELPTRAESLAVANFILRCINGERERASSLLALLVCLPACLC
jgi:hypothetical protein